MFCRHKWEVLSDTTLESPFDTFMNGLVRGGAGKISTLENWPSEATKQVTICSCTKCGKIKKFTTQAG